MYDHRETNPQEAPKIDKLNIFSLLFIPSVSFLTRSGAFGSVNLQIACRWGTRNSVKVYGKEVFFMSKIFFSIKIKQKIKVL